VAGVVLSIGGISYRVACRDGGEPHLMEVARLLDDKVAEATRAMGEMAEARRLLFASLLLADELLEVRRSAAASTGPALAPATVQALENLAARLEQLADGVEAGQVIT
jgi:cell division protein ZapA